jgi:hypothetical protein
VRTRSQSVDCANGLRAVSDGRKQVRLFVWASSRTLPSNRTHWCHANGTVGPFRILTYTRTILAQSPCTYVCMYVCIYVCMHVCMYVSVYVHTMYVCMYVCYVLTNPSIPSSRSKRFILLRPNFFYIARELTQGSLLVTTFRFFVCFFYVITS